MLLFTVLTLSTFFITTLDQAIVMVSLVGICWAVACWVPFAIIMEVSSITSSVLMRFGTRLLCTSSSKNSVKNPKWCLHPHQEVPLPVVAKRGITSVISPHHRSIAGVGRMNEPLFCGDVPSARALKMRICKPRNLLRVEPCWEFIT